MIERGGEGVRHESQGVDEVALSGPVAPNQKGARTKSDIASGDALEVSKRDSFYEDWQPTLLTVG